MPVFQKQGEGLWQPRGVELCCKSEPRGVSLQVVAGADAKDPSCFSPTCFYNQAADESPCEQPGSQDAIGGQMDALIQGALPVDEK